MSLVWLFLNRPDARFVWSNHEQVATGLQRVGLSIGDKPSEVINKSYRDPAPNQVKQRRNLTILQASIADAKGANPLAHSASDGDFERGGEVRKPAVRGRARPSSGAVIWRRSGFRAAVCKIYDLARFCSGFSPPRR